MKVICPHCDSTNYLNIEYGYPSEEMIKRIEEGVCLHGGCVVQGLMPRYFCIQCENTFDTECSDDFIDHIQSIYTHLDENIVNIVFAQDKLMISHHQQNDEIIFSESLRQSLKETQIEYCKVSDIENSQILIKSIGSYRDFFSYDIKQLNPRIVLKFQEWLKLIA